MAAPPPSCFWAHPQQQGSWCGVALEGFIGTPVFSSMPDRGDSGILPLGPGVPCQQAACNNVCVLQRLGLPLVCLTRQPDAPNSVHGCGAACS